MVFYRAMGLLPPKRHILFELEDGTPCFEEFIGEEGFSSNGSLLYHLGVPSNLVDSQTWELGDLSTEPNRPLGPRHFRLPELFENEDTKRDVVRDRRLILGNDDVRISYVVATEASPLYANGIGDEVLYIESGKARVESVFGTMEVGEGDNVVIPRVTIHRWIPLDTTDCGPLKAYVVESTGHVRIPDKYLSKYGQFLEGSPLTERDIRGPEGPFLVEGQEAEQDTPVYVKHAGSGGAIEGSIVTYDHHPFDVVGWDGYLYPYAFNYRDFSPVTGELIQPPPVYQILEGDEFVICNFVPRKLEYHPKAIKVPYYHSNVDADEVMFYHAGETPARKGSGIANASVSLHPAAYTHGPGREAYLASPGMTESTEMAFMVDTYNRLEVGEGGLATDDPSYAWHWSGRGPGLDAGE